MATMLQVHSKALATQSDIYHLFLSKYSKTDNVVYGFVEGQSDPSFYKTFIDSLLPNEWHVELRFVKGREKIFSLYENFDWQRFPIKRIAFFIDRDLSHVLKENIQSKENIYITDKYSIENDVVSRYTCNRIFEEIYNLHQASDEDRESLLKLFDEQLEVFFKLMIPIMSYISLWRSRNDTANLNNLKLNKIFNFSCGKIAFKSDFATRSKLVKFLYRTCNVSRKSRSGVKKFEDKFRKENCYRKFTRGKYLIWFFAMFCEDIYSNCQTLCSSLRTKPSGKLSLNEGNALLVMGQRTRLPNSLREFLTHTFLSYVVCVNPRNSA